jgi:hypothetical protein
MFRKMQRVHPLWWICWVALATAAYTTGGIASLGDRGTDPYQPTQLDWLVLQLNAKDRLQNPFGSGLVEYVAAPPDTVVIRLLPSQIRLGSGGIEEVIQTARRVTRTEALMWGFEPWLQTRAEVLNPGVSLR